MQRWSWVFICVFAAVSLLVLVWVGTTPRMTVCATEPDPVKQKDICTSLIESRSLQAIDLLWAYVNRAGARAMLGDVDGAVEDLDFAISRDPDFAAAYYMRGQVRLHWGSASQALEDFNGALDRIDVWEGRPMLQYGRNLRGHIIVDQDLRLNLLLSRSSALVQLKRLDEAETDAKAALNLDPGDPRPYNNLGYIHLLRENWEAAAQYYNQALSIAPDYGKARAGLRAVQEAMDGEVGE